MSLHHSPGLILQLAQQLQKGLDTFEALVDELEYSLDRETDFLNQAYIGNILNELAAIPPGAAVY